MQGWRLAQSARNAFVVRYRNQANQKVVALDEYRKASWSNRIRYMGLAFGGAFFWRKSVGQNDQIKTTLIKSDQ